MATLDNSKSYNSTGEQNDSAEKYCIDFHGAAIIDTNGNEIAITEEMVLTACQSLDDHWPLNPYQRNRQN